MPTIVKVKDAAKKEHVVALGLHEEQGSEEGAFAAAEENLKKWHELETVKVKFPVELVSVHHEDEDAS